MLARRYPIGVAQSPDDALRQYATGRTARHLEEAAAQLAYWLEERDSIAALLSAMIPDLRRQPLGYSAPAGQGSLLLRQVRSPPASARSASTRCCSRRSSARVSSSPAS